jgi:hypothetical protein
MPLIVTESPTVGFDDEMVALMKGFAPVTPLSAGKIVVAAFVGADATPETGSTTSAASSTRAMTAIPRDTDFFIRKFLGSNYY